MTRKPLPLLLAAALAAVAPPLPAAQGVDILILSPRPGESIFGQVEIAVEVLSSEEVAEVVFLVDGRQVARLTAPPFRTTVDFGQVNMGHDIEIYARSVSGAEGRVNRSTPAIAVNEELDLELQQLYVTVTRDRARVLNLDPEEFRILDNGEAQKIVTFERGDVPLTAALLVDASFSMQGERLRLAVSGARRFVEEMKPLDEATLLLFSDRLLYTTPFTDDPTLLTAALGSVIGHGGTAINDTLYLALKRLEVRQGRRVVVLLTDGVDVESALGMDDVLWMARRSQTLIYWIRILDLADSDISRFTAWRNAASHKRQIELLAQSVSESGGRIVDIENLSEAEGVFHEILRELRDQYVLGYYPTRNLNDGGWHEVKVRLPPGLEVRTREGYIDF